MTTFERITLTTPRLSPRPLREDDAQALFAMYSDPKFMRYWSFAVMTRLEQVGEHLSRILKACASGRDLICALELRASGQMIGTCTLFNLHESCQRAETGFGLRRE